MSAPINWRAMPPCWKALTKPRWPIRRGINPVIRRIWRHPQNLCRKKRGNGGGRLDAKAPLPGTPVKTGAGRIFSEHGRAIWREAAQPSPAALYSLYWPVHHVLQFINGARDIDFLWRGVTGG